MLQDPAKIWQEEWLRDRQEVATKHSEQVAY
jgi:hypothetical protein